MTVASDLQKISALTLAHYDENAEGFREATRDHDVSQNIAALLRHIVGESPFTILDFGCGPGRLGGQAQFWKPSAPKPGWGGLWRRPGAGR